jgi:hypothetical protein
VRGIAVCENKGASSLGKRPAIGGNPDRLQDAVQVAYQLTSPEA